MAKEFRVESFDQSVFDFIQREGSLTVNGATFTFNGNRALSEPLEGSTAQHFYGATGYRLVRADEPFEYVSDLGNEGAIVDQSVTPKALVPITPILLISPAYSTYEESVQSLGSTSTASEGEAFPPTAMIAALEDFGKTIQTALDTPPAPEGDKPLEPGTLEPAGEDDETDVDRKDGLYALNTASLRELAKAHGVQFVAKKRVDIIAALEALGVTAPTLDASPVVDGDKPLEPGTPNDAA